MRIAVIFEIFERRIQRRMVVEDIVKLVQHHGRRIMCRVEILCSLQRATASDGRLVVALDRITVQAL